MNQDFLDKHTLNILEIFSNSSKPLDLVLSNYFASHRNLGSKDRKIIGNTIYDMVRWKSLIDHFNPSDRLDFFKNQFQLKSLLESPSIPNFAKSGLSPFLYNKLSQHYGEETASKLGSILNESAPTTIRINPLKTNRENLLELWKDRYNISACTRTPFGITFAKREALFCLEEYKSGLFELQDEGSQLICEAIDLKAGDCVLDYCSGSGGKTLGFAHKLQGKGQIYLHDIRPNALKEAKIRLRRAGIQNAQILTSEHPQMEKIKHKCDVVLIDVPCSGTGTLRRNPDQKWKISQETLDNLCQTQKQIIKQAIDFLKPSGRLVYATCSILPEENEFQVDYICKEYGLKIEKPPLKLLPESNGPDGFFAVIFRK